MRDRSRRHTGLASALLVLLVGCGGPQPPTSAPTSALAPAKPDLVIETDAELIESLWVNPVHAWATSSLGVLRWSRPFGPFERLPGSPIGGQIVVDDVGVPYLGLEAGVAWLEEGKWRRLAVGPLLGGVRALAPKAGGGVWLAMTTGLGFVERGRLSVVAPKIQPTDILRASDGGVWIATRADGLLRVRGERLERYGPEHGLCGPGARVLRAGGGVIAATCGVDRVSLFDEAGGRGYQARGLDGAIKWATPRGRSLIVRTQGGWARLSPAEGAVSVAQPLPIPAVKAPPAPASKPTSQPTSAPTLQPAAPAAPPPPKDTPFDALEWAITRAPVKHAPAQAWALGAFEPAVEAPTAVHFAVDASIWYAARGQGLVVTEGAKTRRLNAHSLRPLERSLLVLDPQGQPLMVAEGIVLKRVGGRWRRWRVGEGRVLSLGYAPGGQLLALTQAEKKLQLWQQDGAAWRKLIERPMFGLDGPAQCGQLHATLDGRYYAALFWRDEALKLRGEGLLHLTNDTLQIWEGAFEDAGEVPTLPDSWVNRVLLDGKGGLWVATNAGLMSLAGGQKRVFDENDFMDSDTILDVVEDAAGRIWLATLEGLGRLENGRWASAEVPGLKGRVDALAVDQGRLWAAGGGAIYCRGSEAWREILTGQGEIYALRATPERLWVLTQRGLGHLDGPFMCE